MTRPDWCPADIWEDAGLWLVGRAHLEPSDREWVARAIFAERNRCIKKAKRHLEVCQQVAARSNLVGYAAEFYGAAKFQIPDVIRGAK